MIARLVPLSEHTQTAVTQSLACRRRESLPHTSLSATSWLWARLLPLSLILDHARPPQRRRFVVVEAETRWSSSAIGSSRFQTFVDERTGVWIFFDRPTSTTLASIQSGMLDMPRTQGQMYVRDRLDTDTVLTKTSVQATSNILYVRHALKRDTAY